MGELFDDIARVLAGPLPRRRAIFQAAGLLAGAALAGLRPAISEADTVCCDPQTNRCCPPGVACCGLGGPHGAPNCCGHGQTCCNPATGACCSPGELCCRGACLPHGIPCCDTGAQLCGRVCCPDGQTCCDPHVGLCCPAGQVCIVSGGRHVCGQPCGNTVGVQNFCVNGEVCCGSVCCPTGQACCSRLCQPPLCCAANQCTATFSGDSSLQATAGDTRPPNLSTWFDTKFNLIPGCQVCVAVTGTADSGNGNITTPAGDGPIPGCTGPAVAPDCNAGFGAVIGVVGAGAPFYIGAFHCFTGSGRLFLAYNDAYGAHFNNSGNYQVSIIGPCD